MLFSLVFGRKWTCRHTHTQECLGMPSVVTFRSMLIWSRNVSKAINCVLWHVITMELHGIFVGINIYRIYIYLSFPKDFGLHQTPRDDCLPSCSGLWSGPMCRLERLENPRGFPLGVSMMTDLQMVEKYGPNANFAEKKKTSKTSIRRGTLFLKTKANGNWMELNIIEWRWMKCDQDCGEMNNQWESRQRKLKFKWVQHVDFTHKDFGANIYD